MNQTLYLIRHGHSLHNELFHTLGVKAFRIKETIDAPLTVIGEQQSIELGHSWKNKHEIELVLVSPLMRALQTTANIFNDTTIPIICKEFIREYPIGEDTCNQRSDLSTMKHQFSQIDFSEIEEMKDIYWSEERETIESLNQRIELMETYIRERKETKIAIIGHGSFIGHLKDNHMPYAENGDEELKHCYPYEYHL
jgi:broad specificity phosphatase PhoE